MSEATIGARLPGPVADLLADRALRRGVELGLLPDRKLPDWAAFRDFRQRVREAFEVPQTSVTPLMARLLYGVAHLARPARILVVGSYYANTLVWLAGPGFGPVASYPGEAAVGVDVDAEAVAGAAGNVARLGTDGRISVAVLDGHAAGDRIGGRFDLVLLDADDPIRRKEVYLSLLDALLPHIADGGLVLAHDICVPVFGSEMARYQQATRDPDRFSGTVSYEIDPCGLELSRKAGR